MAVNSSFSPEYEQRKLLGKGVRFATFEHVETRVCVFSKPLSFHACFMSDQDLKLAWLGAPLVDCRMSSQGWSCGTLGDGYKAVVGEEEAALIAQEEAILKEIQECLYFRFF